MVISNTKKQKKEVDNKKPTNDVKKLSMFVTIVNHGQGNYVAKIFESEGASAQFIQLGEGTAKKEIRDILGIDDNTKEIVLSIVKNENIKEIKKELEAFFRISKRNKGIGFSIPMTSLIGMKVYQFLADVL